MIIFFRFIRNSKIHFCQSITCIFFLQCFDPLKTKYPKFMEKVELVYGDCLLPDVGLAPESLKMLQEEVTTVFHIAATVKFDEHLKSAAFINVRSLKDLLKLAKGMPNLKVYYILSYLGNRILTFLFFRLFCIPLQPSVIVPGIL